MPIPNAHQATILPENLSGYLLNPLHPVGGPKASWFLMLGYQTEVPELLAADLLKIVGSDGKTVGVVTLKPEDIRRLDASEILHARRISA